MVDRYNRRGLMNARGSGACSQSDSRAQTKSCARANTCGCGDNSCKHLVERLQKIDFSMIDTVLYLDMYPCCKRALEYYHKLKQEREKIMDTLAKSCDMPMVSFDNASEDSWSWTKGPWPWEPSAN